MSQNVCSWLRLLTVALLLGLAPALAYAHISALQPVLLDLLRASDCVVAGRTGNTEADERGGGVVVLLDPISWCGIEMPPRLRLRVQTTPLEGQRYVFFVERRGSSWRDRAPAGILFPLLRQDQQRVHAALRTLWHLRGRPADTRYRAAFLRLLETQSHEWQYHAAIAIAHLAQLSGPLPEAELQRLRSAAQRSEDPALRSLLQHLTGATRALAE